MESFSKEEINLLIRSLNVLANNIRYSLRAGPKELSKEIDPVISLLEKIKCQF